MLPFVGNVYEPETFEPGDAAAYVKFLVGATGAVSTISRSNACFGTPVRLSAGLYYFPLTAAFYSAGVLPGTSVSPLLTEAITVHGAYTTTDGTFGFLAANTTSGNNQRTIAHGADSVVAATKTWTFANGAFTFDDVGSTLTMANTAAAGDKGNFTIKSVTSATVIVTVEAPGADETFGSTVTQAISGIGVAYQLVASNGGAAADPKQGNLVMLALRLKRHP